MDAEGNFVIVWISFDQDDDNDVFFSQRYNADGLTQGDAFQVNTMTASNSSCIAMDTNGNFIINWQSLNQDDNGYGIYAQRYM